MSIKCYTGRMGSGKSYEVVTVVIFGALKTGRRVVSNIAGLNFEAMRDHLLKEGVSEDKIGEIVSIEHDDVMKDNFWLAEGVTDAFLKPGDLLVLDEVWRFWDGFEKKSLPARVMNFFRMHRHFTHPETGVTCDVALITQDVMDISRGVRAVIEENYRMEKLTMVGSSSRYRIDIFAGGNARGKPYKSLQRSYNPDFFCFYNSHSQRQEGAADAQEQNIDNRGNMLSGAMFKIVMPVMVIVLGFAGYWIWGFFHKPPKTQKPAQAQTQMQVKPGQTAPAQSGQATGAVAVPASPQFIRNDEISDLLQTGAKPRLLLYGIKDGKPVVSLEFISDNGTRSMYSQNELQMLGWFLYFSADYESVLLTEGTKVVIVRKRVGRMLNQLRQAR
ncbi:membrane protein [Betaproteobacteria bacterium]|nr:membrane protein [Betaproteobacteria bacterium]GHU24942.1 membrane protein [Betaproteobacteria bacterium]GHU28475.1 membrane protein [Betaproteobacteria bacterium]